MKLLVNALNVSASGPVMVARGLLSVLGDVAPQWDIEVLLRSGLGFETLKVAPNLRLRFVKRDGAKFAWRLYDVYVGLPRYVANNRFDACFTLGDIGPLRLDVPHFVMLHQPWILYRDPGLYQALAPLERAKLHYFRWHFAQQCDHGAVITVQTPVMAQRLEESFRLPKERIHVISSALPLHVLKAPGQPQPLPAMLRPPADNRLLFLASYYPHKNHRILVGLANLLRSSGNPYSIHIYTTVAPGRANRWLLREIEQRSESLTNLGHLSASDVPRALATADAFFLPTLVETFGLVYLEAMASGCPILTSDLDFARWMCGDLALYFQPDDASSVLRVLEEFASSKDRMSYLAERARGRLVQFPTWTQVAKIYIEMIEKHLG